jgi:hypothetical protein
MKLPGIEEPFSFHPKAHDFILVAAFRILNFFASLFFASFDGKFFFCCSGYCPQKQLEFQIIKEASTFPEASFIIIKG